MTLVGRIETASLARLRGETSVGRGTKRGHYSIYLVECARHAIERRFQRGSTARQGAIIAG